MKPRESPSKNPQFHLFRVELSRICNSSHRLVKLSKVVDWPPLEALFGSTFTPEKGRPGISTRLMVALHFLKFTFDLSEEQVLEAWKELLMETIEAGLKVKAVRPDQLKRTSATCSAVKSAWPRPAAAT